MTPVQEALSVLGRTAGWLAQGANADRARYVEATLGTWAEAGVNAADSDAVVADAFRRIRDALAGFDVDALDARRARVAQVVAELDLVRARVGDEPAPPSEPRAVLLPEGIAADLPPRPPPPPSDVAPPVEPVEAEPRREERGEGRREERGEGRREERGEGRREERSEGRREERSEGRREERSEGRREGRGERAEGEPRREGRGERPEGEGRRDRFRDRKDRRDRGGEGERRETEARAEAPRPEPVKVEPPPPPPEVRTFPLGHPEASGETLATLGLPPEEVEAWAAAGVTTGADLLLRAPIAVERAGERWIPGVTPDGPGLVRGTVRRRATRYLPGGVRRYEFLLASDRGDVHCRWLSEPPAEVRALTPGSEAGLAGRLEVEDDVPVLFEGEVLGVDGRGGDWLPRYGVPDLPETRARAAIRVALRRYADALQDHLPPEVIERYKLMPLAQAVRDAHFPSNAGRKGRSRLGFDEFLQVQLGVALLRQRERRDRGVSTPVSHALVSQALGMLGWSFTDEQEAAFDDLRRDLRKPLPMGRLLQGDVGVGKNAVVQAVMLVAAEARHQTIYIAPDAVSAEHRFLFAEALFKSVGIEPMLLTGSPTRTQAEQLRKGDTLVVYATPAVLKDPPALRKLGLVVYEEAGPYGGADISALEAAGHRPDLLVFTPTPVPSAIALNVYGALGMTVIASSAVRGADTVAFPAPQREEAYAIAKQAVEDGQQVMLVFPMSRGQDLLSPSEARRLAEVLGTETFPGARVGIFNGGMSREERFRAYDDFVHRRSDVLLATTYLEHGPIVPGAAVMIVEQAEQYDLVRLHRLRGCVNHGWQRGKCLLVVSDDPRAEAQHNLDLLTKETDGFRIAELDLRHRGIDAVLGDGGADTPDFAWADPVQERDLFVRTRQEAMRLLAADPGLKRRTNRALLFLVRARFGEDGLGEPGQVAPAAEGGGGGAGGGGNRRRRRRRGR